MKLTDPQRPLAGRVAIVTGAGSGMGAAHARELARRGARVGLGDLELAPVQALADSLLAQGREALAGACDVRDAAAVDRFVEAVASHFGGIDVVVSNAGIGGGEVGLADTTDEQWREQFAVHVDGALHLARATLPWLGRSEQGRIVFVSSEWAQRGPGFAHGYCAAKGALLAFARNLAVELAPRGILVNAIAPGTIATPMTAAEDLGALAAQIPVGRVGKPSDVAALVAFLASSESAFITGQTIPINGGATIVGI
jgi:NAD(P)-dependent dehydrogenase (short-subunit alcohol dehydrogenase family)